MLRLVCSYRAEEEQGDDLKCHVTGNPSEYLLHKRLLGGVQIGFQLDREFAPDPRCQVRDGVISRGNHWYHWYWKLGVPAGHGQAFELLRVAKLLRKLDSRMQMTLTWNICSRLNFIFSPGIEGGG